MAKRAFTRDQMDEWDVPYSAVYTEAVDKHRWVNICDAVFKAPDDGKHYLVSYQEGLTERQDGIDYWFDEDRIEGVEVSLRSVTTEEWMAV